MKKAPITKLVTDSRNRVDGKLALRIYVFYIGKQVYLPLKIYLTPQEWDMVKDRSIKKGKKMVITNDDLAMYRSKISFAETRLATIIDNFEAKKTPYDANDIKDEYESAPITTKSIALLELFDAMIAQKKAAGKARGTVEVYECAKKAFKYYLEKSLTQKKASLFKITSIDAAWISEFQKDRASINSDTTINDYIIGLRTVFNFAISDRLIDQNIYPFNSSNKNNYYKIQKSVKTKRALTEDEFNKLSIARPILTTAQKEAWDYFMLSIMLNGANLLDIALLKYSNVDKFTNTIKFIRKKTSDSIDERSEIEVEINEIISNLIRIHGNTVTKEDNFIFPILKKEDTTDDQKRERVSKKLHLFAKKWEIIATKAGIRTDLTFQFARHTYATLALIHDVPHGQISQGMGHADPKTTKIYFATLPYTKSSLNDDMKKKILSPEIFKK